MNIRHPANQLFSALKKIADEQPKGFPKPEGETNEQFHERMAAIARAAFVSPCFDIDSLDPFKQRMKRRHINHELENDYDGDGGREHADYMDDNKR